MPAASTAWTSCPSAAWRATSWPAGTSSRPAGSSSRARRCASRWRRSALTSAHVEAAHVLRLDVLHVDLLDVGARRAVLGEVEHDLDVVGLALEPGLDAAVLVVAHPARDAGAAGAPARGLAEEDALHAPVDHDAPGDRHVSSPSSSAACTRDAISSRCPPTRSLMAPTISDALSICVLAPVSCWRMRLTASSSATARSTMSATAAPSTPSAPPRAMSTRARASA